MLHLNKVHHIAIICSDDPFPSPPPRLTHPEAAGLRHLAFEVDHLDEEIKILERLGIEHEPVRTDEYTQKQFVFLLDPDGLPIELYER